ncbi:hypothetical protein [Roseivirga sp. E12]|uniref:hypothetical protein n=1 Tax=Roseivirga sp. E12 TaxID=2819237 RepID=UPI001ABBFB8F|nr:hypothetical protein [Roseivirga sp. E12]MBO3697671.1 hypothetical protein [Roseivirga sp. E12]
MSNYPEIGALNRIYIDHKVEIQFSTSSILTDKEDYRLVEFKLEGKVFNFFVEDERDDARLNYPLLNLCLVLRELEHYNESSDYLEWTRDHYLDPKNHEVLAHFKNLGLVYTEVEKIIGKIDSQISNWDFEMGSGASWELRKQGLT